MHINIYTCAILHQNLKEICLVHYFYNNNAPKKKKEKKTDNFNLIYKTVKLYM